MKDVFKQLILEFEAFELPGGMLREIKIPALPQQTRKAIAFIGMRRSGKTWILYQHIQKLLAEGIGRDKVLYVNFEDERLSSLQGKDLQSLLDAYFELYPKNVKSERLYFHLDEVQTVPGWEKFIRRLLDARQFDLFISGSSAKLLSKEIATELRGRSLTREVFPFQFSEYLQFNEIRVAPDRVSAKDRAVLLHHLSAFLRRGGFPETLGSTDWVHREILQNYIQIVIYRDIVERHQISSVAVLEKWVVHCLQNPATALSVNKVYGHFKSLGLQVSKNSLYEWLAFLEDAYCLFSIGCFDLSERKSSLKPKKIYPIDPGLITAFAVHPETKLGQTLETAVFRALREYTETIHYYMTKQGWEVDFFIQTPEGKKGLFQSCVSLKEEETRTREIRALLQGMQELDLQEGTIVTLEEEEVLNVPQGTIHIVPAWKFLLTFKTL
ncbi:MAG: ATP-binding protein [Parachlamydia sp.]|nr:ATP-binding protein [Parachlamydia sp.]